MKAGAVRLEAATALTLATAPTAAPADGTAFMSAVAMYAGTTGGWQTRVVRGGRVPRASARVLTVNDVSLCETASSHTGIQVDSIPFTQNGAVHTFVATHLSWASPIWGWGQAVGAASGRSVLRRRRSEHSETAALGLP